MIATVVFLHVLLLARPCIAGAANVSGTRPVVNNNVFANLMMNTLREIVVKNARLAAVCCTLTDT